MKKIKWFPLLDKPVSENIYRKNIVSIAVTVIAFLVFVFFNEKRLAKKKRERNALPAFTIGITTGSHGGRGIKSIDFKYAVSGNIFSSFATAPPASYGVVEKDGRYLIKFSKLHPENAEIIFSCPVPDSIPYAPRGGWDLPPVIPHKGARIYQY